MLSTVAIAIVLLSVASSALAFILANEWSIHAKIDDASNSLSDLKEQMISLRDGVIGYDGDFARLRDLISSLESDIREGVSVPDLSDLVDEFEKEARDRFKGLNADVQTKMFSIMWNSLPYSGRFTEFDQRTKAMYFDAVTSGDWRQLNAKLRK